MSVHSRNKDGNAFGRHREVLELAPTVLRLLLREDNNPEPHRYYFDDSHLRFQLISCRRLNHFSSIFVIDCRSLPKVCSTSMDQAVAILHIRVLLLERSKITDEIAEREFVDPIVQPATASSSSSSRRILPLCSFSRHNALVGLSRHALTWLCSSGQVRARFATPRWKPEFYRSFPHS